MDFRQILPMTALKFLDLRQQAGEILSCPRQNLLENPRTIPMCTGSLKRLSDICLFRLSVPRLRNFL